jgi:dTDP-4-dehydrorhamnose reductase
VLVIGAAGMLGRAACEAVAARGSVLDAVDMAPDPTRGVAAFDMTDPACLARAAGGDWDVVINCAAWTDVDGAEEREEAATRLNGQAVGDLARACREGGAVLVHYSTDYVFDGLGTTPYAVDHPISPVNAYGRSKAAGESLLRESGCEHLLIRTSWLYGPWGKNFVRTMVSLMRTKEELRVVDDQRGRPSSVRQLARTTLALLDAGARGTFHGCDGGECTWHGFAAEIRDAIGSGTAVHACSSDEFPRPAARPAYSVMDLSETIAVAGEPRAWQEELRSVIEEAERLEETGAEA